MGPSSVVGEGVSWELILVAQPRVALLLNFLCSVSILVRTNFKPSGLKRFLLVGSGTFLRPRIE